MNDMWYVSLDRINLVYKFSESIGAAFFPREDTSKSIRCKSGSPHHSRSGLYAVIHKNLPLKNSHRFATLRTIERLTSSSLRSGSFNYSVDYMRAVHHHSLYKAYCFCNISFRTLKQEIMEVK